MGIIKKIVHFMSIIIYILIVVYALIWLPNIFGYKPLVILSGSMRPTYDVGTIIYTKRVERENIKKGDIITYVLDNSYVSHRVEDIIDNEYVTKGDANNSVDMLKVKYEKIIGKNYDITIKYLGYYIKFVGEHLYLLTIVILILGTEFLLANRENFGINISDKGGKENEK